MHKTINLNIDGLKVQAHPGQTIVQAAKSAGITIPTLCHDTALSPHGACGICIVEAEGFPKFKRACATLAEEGMEIRTDSERIRAARRTILALMLSDHSGNCRPPCLLACPAETDCQGYVSLIANGEYAQAAELIREKLPLPSSIGRICPHPCEGECRRQLAEEPVNIAALKYFAGDLQLGAIPVPTIPPASCKSVAVIGGGPGGLTAAYFLRRLGHSVTVYDSMPKMGGMLRYGIPEYRLPKKVLDAELRLFEEMGIVFKNNTRVGRVLKLDELPHDAAIIAIGAWESMPIGCKGEEKYVVKGIEFLRGVAQNDTALMARYKNKKVAVVGGGFTAMDVARTAIRLGAESVSMVYRRTEKEMPALDEMQEAKEEGVIFRLLEAPLEILGGDSVTGLRVQKMQLGEPDASGRRSPVPIPGAEETLDVDIVISAIGQTLDIGGLEALQLSRRGAIGVCEEDFSTNIPGIFAVGDAINRGSIAIEAIGHAKKAAQSVHSWLLTGKTAAYTPPILVRDTKTEVDFAAEPRILRKNARHIDPSIRRESFCAVSEGFTEEEARAEAARCLACGCADFFECKLVKYANEYQAQAYKAELKHKYPMDESHPYFYRDPNKCILCGMCARVCDELVGQSVYSVVRRGLSARVETAYDMPIEASDCVGCGTCVYLCPTGALAEKLPIEHPLVAEEERVRTACTVCSVGCRAVLTSRGGLLLRKLPDTESDPAAMLCSRGRFESLEEADSGKDFCVGDAPQSVPQEILQQPPAKAIAVSGNHTNEEIATAKEFAAQNGAEIFSFDVPAMPEIFLISDRKFEDLLEADTIIWSGAEIMKSHTIAGSYAKRAARSGEGQSVPVRCGPVRCGQVRNGAKLLTFAEADSAKPELTQKSIMLFDPTVLDEAAKKIIEESAAKGAGRIALLPGPNSRGLIDAGIPANAGTKDYACWPERHFARRGGTVTNTVGEVRICGLRT